MGLVTWPWAHGPGSREEGRAVKWPGGEGRGSKYARGGAKCCSFVRAHPHYIYCCFFFIFMQGTFLYYYMVWVASPVPYFWLKEGSHPHIDILLLWIVRYLWPGGIGKLEGGHFALGYFYGGGGHFFQGIPMGGLFLGYLVIQFWPN